MKQISTQGFFSVVLWMLQIAAHAQTSDQVRTLHVANNGVDSTSCGVRTQPCRSINQAITNARDGDTVLVGPGRYGDVARNGDFNDPEDERGDVFLCGGIVCVNKRLTLLSTNGAAATLIDAAHNDLGQVSYGVVSITANGVTFGRKGKGFTVANANRGLQVSHLVSNVTVSGNTASGNGVGFSISGESDIFIRDNVATNNNEFAGFLTLHHGSGTILLSNNSAISNDLVPGFFILGTGRQVIRTNISSDNAFGFLVNGDEGMVFQFNIASNNNGSGFDLQGSGHIVRNNLAVANRGAGIFISVNSGDMEVHANNIFGNLGGGNFFFPNCGLTNQSGHEFDARNNYWGASSGPGRDPADEASRHCDTGANSVTIVEPFAREPFPISP